MKSGKIIAAIVALGILGGGYLGGQFYADREADRRIGKVLTQLPPGVRVRYESAGYSLLSGKVKLGNIAITSKAAGNARIESLTLVSYDTFNKVPHYAKLRVRGFEMRADKAKPATRAWMKRLGYDKITIDVDYAYRYRPGLRELTIEEFRIRGKEVGTLRFEARVGNIARIDVGNYAQLIAVALQAVVRGGRLTFEDSSLVGRFIRDRARTAGQSEAKYRETLLGGIDGEMRRTKSASLRRQFQHVRAFVEKPGRITFELSPRRAVPVLLVAGVRDAGLLQRILGIKVTATPLRAKKKN
ncbi:MAG: hypothetical protein ACTSUD_07580 [Alphaproteobacteria bacterium]